MLGIWNFSTFKCAFHLMCGPGTPHNTIGILHNIYVYSVVLGQAIIKLCITIKEFY